MYMLEKLSNKMNVLKNDRTLHVILTPLKQQCLGLGPGRPIRAQWNNRRLLSERGHRGNACVFSCSQVCW